MPRVSIILPTYRRPSFLRLAISSVLNQTFEDFELIVFDDASGDNTVEIIGSFDDRRIRYVCLKSNRGEAGARNAGLRNVDPRAEFVAFLDDDDEWLPEKLKKQVEFMESAPSGIGCVYTGFYIVDSYTKRVIGKRLPSKRGDLYNDLLVKNEVGTPSTVLLRRECINRVGVFDESISYGVDHDLWIRISRYFKFDFIEEALVRYHIHEKRLSNDPYIVSKGFDDMLSKYGIGLLDLDRDYYGSRYLAMGVLFCLMGDVKRGRRCLLRALILNPYNLRTYFYLALSFGGVNLFKKIKKLIEIRKLRS
jgi:glycosyltransferase involved in cell wall biosynthesis